MRLIEIAKAEEGIITNAPKISDILLNAFKFLLSIAGILAIISLVAAGIIYYLAGGNPEAAKKGKKMIFYSVIGIALVMGGMLIIKTIEGFIK